MGNGNVVIGDTVIEPKISAKDLRTWAGFLLDHSLEGIEPEDRVMIKGERICWPLMEELEQRIIKAGAIADIYLVPPNNERGRVWSSTMGRHGTPQQLDQYPDWYHERYASMTKYIEILGAEDPSRYADLDPERVKQLVLADRPFANIRLSKPWVLTLYPTQGFAAMEGMELEEYAQLIVRACTTDPRPLKAAEERIAPYMERAKLIKIVTHHPQENRELTLTLNKENSRVILSYGLRNFPDGEIFTSPDARSAEGEIFLDLPVHYGGHDIQGIFLKFQGGQITAYRAELGHEYLKAIIETDAGSHRLGEVALGMNTGMKKMLKHPLFVEKVGGTLHLAIGQSYEECFVDDPSSERGEQRLEALEAKGILNRSAQHVDIVVDFRRGGCGRRLFFDNYEMVPKNGMWVAV
jgi:aminopeptidase